MATKQATKADDDQGQGDPPAGQAADAKNPTMAEVMAAIREQVDAALAPVLDALKGGGKAADNSDQGTSQGGAPSGADLGRLVDDAIGKVLKDRDAQSEADAHRKAHEDLAARPEVRPIARLRRSRWLGDIWDRNS